ncbi:unnamed protein product [Rhizophagus irregularis]|nr:unnamed protein product [Rhizophagus irregularis]
MHIGKTLQSKMYLDTLTQHCISIIKLHEKDNNKEKNKIEEQEKELYGKVCVAKSINFTVNRASNEIIKMKITIILARDREVAPIRLENLLMAVNFTP